MGCRLCSPTAPGRCLHFECRGAPARVRAWRCEGRPPLPNHFVCVETFTLPYLKSVNRVTKNHERLPRRTQLQGRQRHSTRDTLRSRRLASPMLAQRCLSVCARAAALRGPRGRRTQWEGDDRATVTLRISLNNHYIRACAAPLRVRLSTSVACAYNPLHLVVQP